MSSLSKLRKFFEQKYGVCPGGKLLAGTITSDVVDKNGDPIPGTTTTLYFNKNSANDPNPNP